ncbi:MAG: hypothetical protein J3Q66DRAFT_373450 [Benniella sp.]|nr:MAG: hypothetical protein J3Q66DRAFT_373450 [Benniella sp.]
MTFYAKQSVHVVRWVGLFEHRTWDQLGLWHFGVRWFVKQTWKEGPPIPRAWIEESSYAISGDQVVVWEGSLGEKFAGATFTTTFVFNIKSEKCISSYIPPLSQPSQMPVTIPEPDNTSSSNKKLVIIIAAVTGTLLAATLGLIFRYHRRTRLPNPNESSTGLLDIKDSVKIPRPGLRTYNENATFKKEHWKFRYLRNIPTPWLAGNLQFKYPLNILSIDHSQTQATLWSDRVKIDESELDSMYLFAKGRIVSHRVAKENVRQRPQEESMLRTYRIL